jgi:hypothetical protein
MIIFADEFLFFNHAVLPAMLPTLATGAAFIMTSSVSPDGDNPLLKLLSAKYPDGTDVVKNLNWIQSCKNCERRGLAERCTHIASIAAPLKRYITLICFRGTPTLSEPRRPRTPDVFDEPESRIVRPRDAQHWRSSHHQERVRHALDRPHCGDDVHLRQVARSSVYYN